MSNIYWLYNLQWLYKRSPRCKIRDKWSVQDLDCSPNQTSKRPVRSECLKLWKIRLNQKDIVMFSLIHNWPDWLKIKQNFAEWKHLTKPTVYTRTTSGTILSADVAVMWFFSIQTWCISLAAFASKKPRIITVVN